MFPVLVCLTDGERHRAAREGRRRFAYANATQIFRPLTAPLFDPETVDMQAAGAELAVARYLGLHWTSEGAHRGADVGELIQVRYATKDGGFLRIRERDSVFDSYVLATGGLLHDFRIVGWMPGKDGKIPRWERPENDGGHVYLIPQAALRRDRDVDFLR